MGSASEARLDVGGKPLVRLVMDGRPGRWWGSLVGAAMMRSDRGRGEVGRSVGDAAPMAVSADFQVLPGVREVFLGKPMDRVYGSVSFLCSVCTWKPMDSVCVEDSGRGVC